MKYLLPALLFCVAAPVAAQEVLTNDTILTLAKAGLGDQTVVAKIKTSPNSFNVGADKLIDLKRQGLSEAVIAAMIEASSRSTVATTAMMAGAADSPDPRQPHPSGIYMLDSTVSPARMVRMDATSSNQTKSGGFLGYALTGGIAKMKINTVISGPHARISTQARRPKFYFFFDQASASLSGGAPGGFWVGGPGAAVTSPNEFSLVRFEAKKDRREAAVGSFNIGGAKAGVQDKQRVAMTYVDVRPGVFEVTPQQDLAPGEYGFIYSMVSGGGVGAYGAGATMSRIFDFSIGAPVNSKSQRS
ncbi:hypothetical protein [Sphingomonas aracearum]|uniref:Uncharacterized protein n=1 Tax=Sphingomonas aracearum TaxID=2283317 RepID=A0A369VX47_9SPHN|nr:hypothetical protein [Sphingomonas aracearum]RDE06195.1 hypothetical protein DVW87_00165 [Sphingomonas aracearum]